MLANVCVSVWMGEWVCGFVYMMKVHVYVNVSNSEKQSALLYFHHSPTNIIMFWHIFFLLLWLEWIRLWAWTRWRRSFLRPESRRTPCWTRRSSAARSRHPEQAPQKKFQFLLKRKYLLRIANQNKSANYYSVVLKIITRQSKWRSSFLSYIVLPNNYN